MKPSDTDYPRKRIFFWIASMLPSTSFASAFIAPAHQQCKNQSPQIFQSNHYQHDVHGICSISNTHSYPLFRIGVGGIQGHKVSTPLFAMGRSNEESSNEIEAARQHLEDLIMGKKKSSSSNNFRASRDYGYLPLTTELLEVQLPPKLTEAERKYQAKEIELLSSLYQSEDEDILTDLWTHWFGERGPGPAAQLLHAEQLANTDDGVNTNYYQREAERLFRKLIDEHGLYWAEPVNRLATLLYRQGRLEESKACCELVLAVKPWHFGALSGIVMVCVGMKDSVNAKIWADRRLPPLQPSSSQSIGSVGGRNNERRKDWIKRAVRDATMFLFRQQDQFTVDDDDDMEGKDETKEEGNNIISNGIYTDDSDDSWQ